MDRDDSLYAMEDQSDAIQDKAARSLEQGNQIQPPL
ncbi:hypothetical protein HAL1_17211 [Halomonas sp. HAL1]|nr:hypothetical protein HAL1_17211 [Halomonas sp. HAL1]